MGTSRPRRPSAAFVIAMLALCAAVAGTAIAGPVTVSLNKKEKKQTKKIAKKVAKKIAKNKANTQIKKKAPGLSVATAKTADNATQADSASDADQLGGQGPNAYKTESAKATGTGDIAVTSPSTTVLETTITVPAARTITAFGSVTAAGDGGGDDTLNCRTRIAGTDGILQSQFLNGTTLYSLSVNGAEAVAAGTHTVQLVCQPSILGNVTAKNRSLSVVATG